MSLPQPTIFQVPQATARVARAIFPKGNLYMQLHDTLGSVYEEDQFADVFSHTGQPCAGSYIKGSNVQETGEIDVPAVAMTTISR